MARTLLLCIGLCLVPLQTQAAEFYVDPVNGSPTGDGSADRPWRTIQEVFDARLVESQQWDKLPYTPQSKLVPKNAGAPVRAGDTIWLRSGFHGDLLIDKYYNLGPITLAAEKGHTPRLSSLHIRSGSHWTIRGLAISPEFSRDLSSDTPWCTSKATIGAAPSTTSWWSSVRFARWRTPPPGRPRTGTDCPATDSRWTARG